MNSEDRLDITLKCYSLLEELVRLYPESLEEVLDDLHGCLLFYGKNAKSRETLKPNENLIRAAKRYKNTTNLQLEIF